MHEAGTQYLGYPQYFWVVRPFDIDNVPYQNPSSRVPPPILDSIDVDSDLNCRLLILPFSSPCSVHSVESATEYARLLRDYAETAKEDLHIIMRVYFEKPRT